MVGMITNFVGMTILVTFMVYLMFRKQQTND